MSLSVLSLPALLEPPANGFDAVVSSPLYLSGRRVLINLEGWVGSRIH